MSTDSKDHENTKKRSRTQFLSEKKYRSSIYEGIEALRNLVPGCNQPTVKKSKTAPNKSSVLKRSVEFIEHQRCFINDLECRVSLANGISSSTQPINNENYVESQLERLFQCYLMNPTSMYVHHSLIAKEESKLQVIQRKLKLIKANRDMIVYYATQLGLNASDALQLQANLEETEKGLSGTQDHLTKNTLSPDLSYLEFKSLMHPPTPQPTEFLNLQSPQLNPSEFLSLQTPQLNPMQPQWIKDLQMLSENEETASFSTFIQDE